MPINIFKSALDRTQAAQITTLIVEHGHDILVSPGMEYERNQPQHGSSTCFSHSLTVAYASVWMAMSMDIPVDVRSLIRGALLHDYFLYDWRDKSHPLHAFSHANTALENAERDFELSDIERDIIARHMFPLTPIPPRYRESTLVSLADKICATLEVTAIAFPIPLPGAALRRVLV